MKPPTARQFYGKKLPFKRQLHDILNVFRTFKKAKLLRFGRILEKNLFCSDQSAPARLLVKYKIRLKAERSRIWLKSFK